ncbi:MAG: pimeloyl-ACP methyl ester carboxylesterase [Gammaproteobacteria bacterium]|jgi:pimeloyl-ACP methyl ester carboxylesterase
MKVAGIAAHSLLEMIKNDRAKNQMTKLVEWKNSGRRIQTPLFKHKVFIVDLGDTTATPKETLLLIHGFPESSFSYHKVVDGLLKTFKRIVLFDFIGYGYSDKPTSNYSYSLFEQADVAFQVWHQLGVKGGHLLSHDMGDSVATELAARDVAGNLPAWFSEGFQSYTFTNGSMVLDLAKLRLGQKALLSGLGSVFSKLSTKRLFVQQAASAHGNDHLDLDDLDHMWQQTTEQNGHRLNHKIIQYLKDRKRFEKIRWLPSLSKLKQPIHLCWGEADAVASVAMAHHLKANVCTQATLTLMPNVGHFCQLSDPDIWVKSVSKFYN